MRHLKAAVLFLLPVAGGAAHAAGTPREWALERDGITFELTAADLRAWKGTAREAPVLSFAALLGAERADFEKYRDELARDLIANPEWRPPFTTFSMDVSFEVLSVVGPLVGYRQRGGDDTPGAAHPGRYHQLHVVDVRHPDRPPSLLDYYSERDLVAALKKDAWVQMFASAEDALASASTLEALVGALDGEPPSDQAAEAGDCAFDGSFSVEGLTRSFYFHHLEKGKVAVRIAVPPRTQWCIRLAAMQEIGLLLPVPPALGDALRAAAAGRAGFLAGNRKAAGSPAWSGTWEADIAERAEELKTKKK